jgi:hypothetical protein
MKITRIFIVLALLVGLAGYTAAPVKATAFVSYVSGITIQNLESTPTNAQVDYLDQQANVIGSTSNQIPAYGVVDYSTIPLSSGFMGSVIIYSGSVSGTDGGEVGAVSTLRGDNKGRGAYIGSKQGATAVILPFMMKSWGNSNWNTWFAAQNVGGANATITVDYAACSGTNNEQATGVEPGAMVTFDQAAETCFPSSRANTSAVVSSDQPIVVIVSQESTVANASLVSPGFGSLATAPVMPLVNSNNPDTSGWRTAIAIFNNGGVSTNVTVTYVRTDGTTCTETQSIPSKTSKEFAGNKLISGPGAGVTLTCPVGARLVGSAYVSANSANQDLVATVNQDRGGLASAYGALLPTQGTPKVFFPQIQDRNGASSQWSSSFMIMNVGTGSTYVKCTFANTSYTARSGQLNSFRAWEDLQRGKIAPSYVGSGECTAYTNSNYNVIDTAAKIVGVANIRGTGAGLYDLMMSYEGMNATP